MPDGEVVRVGIERLHLEQDAGKSLHDRHPAMSYVDLNRAGVALMEIVSKPDLRSSDEAKAFVAKLRTILRYLGTCDGDMEKGNLRADVNVSVRKPGAPLGTRCEIKNVNSIRFIGQAIEYEARRQIEILEDGGKIEQETRLFDPDKGETRSMRNKEEAHDYRYFPDPDLLPLELTPPLSRISGASSRSCPTRRRRVSRANTVCPAMMPACWSPSATPPTSSRRSPEGARRQGRRQLGHQRTLRAAEQGRQGHRGLAGLGRTARRDPRPDRGRHDFRQDRQGFIRHRLERGRRSAGDRRGARHEAGHRPVRHREGGRRDRRQESGQGGAGEDEAALIGWFVGQVMKASGGKANPHAVNDLLKSQARTLTRAKSSERQRHHPSGRGVRSIGGADRLLAANHLRSICRNSRKIVRSEHICEVLDRFFCTSRSVWLAHCDARIPGRHRDAVRPLRDPDAHRRASKTHISSMFSAQSRKSERGSMRSCRAERDAADTCSAIHDIWYHRACRHAASSENTGFFVAL